MWIPIFIILLLLAVVDLASLWKASRTGQQSWMLSPFTLATQSIFAILAAFYVGPLAFEGFSTEDAVMFGELAFLVLMTIGFVADVRAGRARRAVARLDE